MVPPIAPPETPPAPPPDTKPVAPPTTPPTTPQYPEPTAAKYTPLSALGFYDKDKTGATRAVRNDLGGTLPGMVQFAQSHSVDPSGNEAKNMPRLTAQKEALLLVTPDPSLGEIDSLQVTVNVNGQSKGILPLRHPNLIPRSDYANNDGRPDYVYSRRAWSVALPWDWVQPGLELRVADNKGRSGTLAAPAIDFAGAGELVVNNVRIGMLSNVPGGSHWFRSQPQQAATDYLQTIPAARITAAYYEDVVLSKVMVASGVIYTDMSATFGDVYSGDMRENTGKSTFSVGINLANWGVTSASMASQEQPQVTQMVTAHYARGKYAQTGANKVPGEVNHGLSGGNSILTLINSDGNEFSHEIGHHYGLGHYFGESNGNRFWAGHHHDSGWGYIGYRKRMRANIHWTAAKTNHLVGMAELDDTYTFTPDSMAGGSFASSLSRYTHYTGYSTRHKIQPAFDRPVFDKTSATGYKKWNASTRTMEDFAPTVPKSNMVWYNSTSGKFLPPRLHGVPVVTLLGGYDPISGKALIYPALRGNWGNVFDLPAPVKTEPRACWLKVDFASGKASQEIALAPKLMQANIVNKLHVNLAQSEQPSRAELLCQAIGQPAQSLYVLDIATNQPAMAPAVVVGKEAGYSALRAAELPTLDTALQALAGKAVLNLGANAKLLADSWGDDASGLSGSAQTQLQRYKTQQEQLMRLNRWISAYAADLDANVAKAQSALLAFIDELGLGGAEPIPAGGAITMPNGNCIQKNGSGVRIAAKALCTGDANEKWILDGRGSIRSSADLSLCLTDKGGANAIALAACNTASEAQEWDTSTAQKIARGNRCFDLSGGYLSNGIGKLITYGCTGGANQKWTAPTMSASKVLPLLQGENAKRVQSAVAAQPMVAKRMSTRR